MQVTIKKQDGTEITLTGPGAEMCVVLGALLDSEKPEPEADTKIVIDGSGITLSGATLGAEENSVPSVMLTGPEWDKLVYLHGTGYRWLARDDDGYLFAYREKPFQSGNHWKINEGRYSPVPMELFPFVRIEDEEPTEIAPVIQAMKKEAEI